MKANELRIGNWIKDGNDFEQVTIYHLDCLSIARCEFDPIKLTEEWLLKFGFEKWEAKFNMGSSSQPTVGWIHGKFNLYKSYQGITHEQHISMNNLICKSVHQLQNLYFALTNEELTWTN
jgi:hypothetical protein